MSEKRFELRSYGNDEIWEMKDRQGESLLTWGDIEKKLNQLAEENELLKNELRKEKLLLEYSDSMYNADLIVNIRFSNGEWKADVSVIDDEG